MGTHHRLHSPEELAQQLAAWPIQRAFGWAPSVARVLSFLDCLQLNRSFIHMKCDGTFLICFIVGKLSSCVYLWRERERERDALKGKKTPFQANECRLVYSHTLAWCSENQRRAFSHSCFPHLRFRPGLLTCSRHWSLY